jgi:hypothetical protein
MKKLNLIIVQLKTIKKNHTFNLINEIIYFSFYLIYNNYIFAIITFFCNYLPTSIYIIYLFNKKYEYFHR